MGDATSWDGLKPYLDTLMPDLLELLMSGRIREDDHFMKLVKEGGISLSRVVTPHASDVGTMFAGTPIAAGSDDGNQFEAHRFNQLDEFLFIIVTKLTTPPESFARRMFVVVLREDDDD
eukprot:CAMPEP_0175915760 /NCGR_PEP_ID=MMETSP0108-20121206/10485_1 /TAXON_ID=195067 ORGANISM="Goniomonas pacifica, Strain CCMP1869" /NCGR_SAMPLE_ID=MMETSP0108 /ASSEMBLY_ACC=CAM_ASM_000204 /LENGTH=118 /DNA_ID=CAMNT_0017238267 /DNA_START=66 /DNA_END=423 /DNA_ORIENTATION=+